MLSSKCSVYNSKKSVFIKQQEAIRLLSSLGTKEPFLQQVLFSFRGINKTRYKMNEIVNKFLLAGDKFITEMHLRQPGFIYSACGPFT